MDRSTYNAGIAVIVSSYHGIEFSRANLEAWYKMLESLNGDLYQRSIREIVTTRPTLPRGINLGVMIRITAAEIASSTPDKAPPALPPSECERERIRAILRESRERMKM